MENKFEHQLEKMKALLKKLCGDKYAIEGSGCEKYVEWFENRFKHCNARVYGVKVEEHSFGTVVCLMYIDEKDEYMWEEWERCLKEDHIADCFGFNLDHPEASEFGSCYVDR